MPIERIEVYVDNAKEPIQVLKEPPFKVNFDTTKLPDGDHLMRVVTHYRGGGSEVKEIPFKVSNTPGVAVEGLEEGKEVSGNLEMTIRVGDPDLPPPPSRFPLVGFIVTALVVLGGVWGFFALNSGFNEVVKEVAKTEAAAEGGHGTPAGGTQTGGGEAVAVDQALLTKGQTVFSTNCAGCHQANGAGVPGAFPPLAGNPNLADAEHVVKTVIHGLASGVEVNGVKYTQPMPAFGQLSDEEVAAVATYIRNSWGNKFGGVKPEQAKAAR